jgi:hypothetical protein
MLTHPTENNLLLTSIVVSKRTHFRQILLLTRAQLYLGFWVRIVCRCDDKKPRASTGQRSLNIKKLDIIDLIHNLQILCARSVITQTVAVLFLFAPLNFFYTLNHLSQNSQLLLSSCTHSATTAIANTPSVPRVRPALILGNVT